MSLKIDWATHEAAKYSCEKWHYSSCLPTGKLVKVGVWENSRFIGVVIFSRGASPRIGHFAKLDQTEICELTRVALTNHITPVSRILTIAVKFLRKNCPGLRLVVSYADSSEGHHGGIYQACNWIYVGSTRSPGFVINGSPMHFRSVQMKYGTGSLSALIAKGVNVRKILCEPKLKYLMPLDDEMRKRVQSLSKPYPKRAGSKANVAVGFHSTGDGATPIPALQSYSQTVNE